MSETRTSTTDRNGVEILAGHEIRWTDDDGETRTDRVTRTLREEPWLGRLGAVEVVVDDTLGKVAHVPYADAEVVDPTFRSGASEPIYDDDHRLVAVATTHYNLDPESGRWEPFATFREFGARSA